MATVPDAAYLVNEARVQIKQLERVKGRAKTFGGIHPDTHERVLSVAAEHAVPVGVLIKALLNYWEQTGPTIKDPGKK